MRVSQGVDFDVHRWHLSFYPANDVQGCHRQNNAAGGQAFAADVKFQQRLLAGAHGGIKPGLQNQPGIEVVALDPLLQLRDGFKQGQIDTLQPGHPGGYFGAALVHNSHPRPGLEQAAKNDLHDQRNDCRINQSPQKNR